MAQPTPYEREFNFSNQQAATPATPIPAEHLDAELNRIKLTTDQVLGNLELIQNDSGDLIGGALADGSVGFDQLAADVVANINTDGGTPEAFAAALENALPGSDEFNDALALKADLDDTTAALALKVDTTDLTGATAATSGIDTGIAIKSGIFVLANPGRINALDHNIKPSRTAAQNSAALATLVTTVLALTNGAEIYFPAGTYLFDPAAQVSFTKTSGKYLAITGDEWGGTVFNVGATTTSAFYVGSASTPAGGTNFKARNITFKGGSTTTGRAFTLENANGAKFENCHFSTMQRVVTMTSSYAVQFVGCEFVNVGSYNIYSSTTCHHLLIDKCDVFNAGLTSAGVGSGIFLFIDAGQTDNVVIRDCDFEYCRQVIRADDGLSALIFEGNYVEYGLVDPFDFGTGAYGTSMSNNWIALGSVGWNFANMFGGEFSRNRIHDQAIGFASSCLDVHVADNLLSGTATLSTASLMHTISVFLNSATANGTYPPRYSKSDGVVQLHGQVDNCPGGGAAVFALPAGYRPLQTGAWPAVRSNNTDLRVVIIDASNGNVVPSSAVSEAIRLDGVNFRVAN